MGSTREHVDLKPCATHSSDYSDAPLETQRLHVVQDLPCIPEVTTQDFLNFVIPAVPQKNLENILRLLKSGAVTDGRINGFDKEPRQAGLTEDKQFRHLHNFSERALAIASEELSATATLASRYTPHKTPRSEKRNGSRPDKSLVLKGAPRPSEGRVGWQDIVLAFEFKLDDKDNDLYDNRRKTMWNPHYILRNDPRRLFTFGISIENTCCRFWYFSRSHVMVSQGFNFITNYEPYVQILVGLAFAHVFDPETPAVARVPLRAHGYDPTVQRLDDSGNYSIRVGEKTYITRGVLSDSRAERLCGRCTRVWKVYEEGDRNTFYALKDVWVDRRKQTEGEIWRQLKKKVVKEAFSKYFLTLLNCTPDAEAVTTCDFWARGSHSAEENVRYFEEHVVDHMDLQQPLPTLSPTSSRRTHEHSSRSGIVGGPDDYTTYQLNLRCYRDHPVYTPRRHDRTVWKEICTPYENLTDLSTMIVSLQHTIIALHAMWRGLKAIHRDLSSGNVFYDNKNRSGRLGDLEFVTFYTDDAVYKENSHSLSIKTGTLQFMACEVFAGSYLSPPTILPTSFPLRLDQCLPVPSDMSYVLPVPDTPDTDSHSTEVCNDFDPADETPTFLHNPLHDLESVWWLLVWSLLRFHPQSTPRPDRDALHGQLKVFLALFPGTQAQRLYALRSINHDHASPKVSLIRAALISKDVASLSRELIAMYATAETSFPIPTAAFEGVHERALYSLTLISKKVAKASIGKLVPVHDTLAELEKGE